MNSNEGKEKNIVGVFADDAKLPYDNIGMELSYKDIIRPFVFVHADDDETIKKTNIENVLADYSEADPYLNTCRDGFTTYLQAASMSNMVETHPHDIIYGIGKLYSEYLSNLIITNIISTTNTGVLGVLRNYTKDIDAFNKIFGNSMNELIQSLPSFVQGYLSDYSNGYIKVLVDNDEFAQIDNKNNRYDFDFITKNIASMTFIPVTRITSVFTDVINELLSKDLIDYNKMSKEEIKRNNQMFFAPIDEPTMRMVCAHRYLMSLLNDDMAVISDIIEILTVNTFDKISADIQDNSRVFKDAFNEIANKRLKY